MPLQRDQAQGHLLKRKPEIPKLTKEQIHEALESSLKGAEELHEELKLIFRLPERPLILD